MRLPAVPFRTLAIALPAFFVLHVLEEAPTFVAWFNAHAEPDISTPLFLAVNVGGLLITLLVSALAINARGRATALVATAWVGFLMLANCLLHLTATIVDRAYAPGVVTSLLFYLPFSALWIAAVSREFALSLVTVVAVALLGGTLMYIHGWLLIFEGSRLF